ncbi:MAG TPA: ROK family protein [Flavobacteriales bacterium]|nr:ROK family protein [Flavobacteriales bacterium]HMZ49245.1 ROK family protein [Flavobacteriales bacterium]HNI04741.1 ROK family protein [Flavobacteriales bacterium]HNK68970.1 ROK family protein [Flavobacteriales bacterium]HNK85509.1 ROK family protein [Flavobacteriales bacterium]
MILGIDIGGTTSKLGLVRDGQVIARARIGTTGHADDHAFADALAHEARQLAGAHGTRISAIGIGAPNANQLTGIIEMAPNLPWKHDVPLARMMADRLGAPAVLGNDANAAALGEWRYGAGQGINDLLVVTLGTGVGSGFIVNGQLVLGSAGYAGELGHTILIPGGRDCTCGRQGCLEAYVSIRGMIATYQECGGAPGAMDVKTIADRGHQGEQAAIDCFRLTTDRLAIGLVNAVCATGPKRIVLFGGIARNGDLLMAPLRDRFHAMLLNIYKGRVDLSVSALPDDDAALLGAAALGTLE